MLFLIKNIFPQINLRLILVSGKTKEFLFSPSDSAADIAQHVFDNWPIGNISKYAVVIFLLKGIYSILLYAYF